MDIGKIDINLSVCSDVLEDGLEWYDVREQPFSLHGVFYDEQFGRFLRLPHSVTSAVSDRLVELGTRTAGGRVRFVTDSPYIAIKADIGSHGTMPHMCLIGQIGFDMYRDNIFCSIFKPPADCGTEYSAGVSLSGGLHEYSVNFPLYGGVKKLEIAVKKGSVLKAASPYTYEKPIVFYGSSITEGACASRPGTCYTAMLARRFDADHINLGFSGQAKGEQIMAEYIAGLDMGIFVLDYDHNVHDAQQLEATHKPFYDTVRRHNPNLPIVMISAPDLPFHRADFEPRREVVRQSYLRAVAEGDKNVYYVDGGRLIEGPDWDSCIVDTTHPNDLGYFRMCDGIAPTIEKIYKNMKK